MAALAMISCLVLSILQAYEATKGPSSQMKEPINQVTGMVNGTVYLNPRRPGSGDYQQITWRFNDSLKILIKKKNPNLPSYPNAYFQNKLRYHENHTLEINQLQEQDSSTYTMAMEDSKSEETSEYFQLAVYKPVPKPSVTATVTANKDGRCKATLNCTVNASNETYRWRKDEKDCAGDQSTLDVQLEADSYATYKCIVSNPVSEETGVIYLRPHCQWTEKNSATCLSLARKMVYSIVAFGFLLLVRTWV
ncbi:CD48 antigen [Emydura macquarii macquarii]|uniref:CD48 antigen n=1 Tax=Emydura macquarii macquarii TaxID=1129001 RepID=UPI00352B43BB